MKRSETFDVDADFDVACDVTKATVLPNGRRLIRGVASGVLEDRDGERVSARAIADMAMQPVKGMKLVAEVGPGGHAQSWTNEIGDVVALRVDPESGELLADAELPPEGEDPIADKAWRRVTAPGAKPLGYSIGGKLRKAYMELVEDERGARKRKVLDGVALRHLVLTDKPAYAPSVVAAIAKCASSIVPDDSLEYREQTDDEKRLDQEAIATVAKAAKQPPDDEEPAAPPPQSADAPTDAPTPDPAGNDGQPPAGTADTSEASPDTPPSDAQAAQGLPLTNRHLSCPNCGAEFAAPLPATGPTSDPGDTANDPAEDTAKTKEHTMDTKAVLAQIDALREQLVGKTATDAKESVEKTEPATTEVSDVERLIAQVHKTATERDEATEASIKEGFELIGKSFKALADRVADLPQGRRSHAWAPAKPGVEVEKTATDENGEVTKTSDELAAAGDLLGALKAKNFETYGIR